MNENLKKYKVVCSMFKTCGARRIHQMWKGKTHSHHIKPKSLYPSLTTVKDNIIEVPSVVHWALHEWLRQYYLETGMTDEFKKMSHANVKKFIEETEHLNLAWDQTLLDEIYEALMEACKTVKCSYYTSDQCTRVYFTQCSQKGLFVELWNFQGWTAKKVEIKELCDETEWDNQVVKPENVERFKAEVESRFPRVKFLRSFNTTVKYPEQLKVVEDLEQHKPIEFSQIISRELTDFICSLLEDVLEKYADDLTVDDSMWQEAVDEALAGRSSFRATSRG